MHTQPKWHAVTEHSSHDNFHTSIYEEGWKGLLVARCNQNGEHPGQAEALLQAHNRHVDAMRAVVLEGK